MGDHQKKKPLLFLGAGASIEAGIPSAAAITRHFESFSSHTSRPNGLLIENLFRLVQVEIASQTGIPASNVDFEAVLGVLFEIAEGRNVLSAKRVSELIQSHFNQIDISRVIQDLTLYIRGLCLPLRDVSYLDVLLHMIWEHEGAIATLNYDVSVERRSNELKYPLVNGFGGKTGSQWLGFNRTEKSIEILKLHGSVHWLRSSVDLENAYSILAFLIFHSEPFMTSLNGSAALTASEKAPGVRLLMNIGFAKEQLYVTPPFTEIFVRFLTKLQEASIIIAAGYSFRDPAVNRMLLEAVKAKRSPFVVIDPQVEELVEKRAVVRSLQEYGILIKCSKKIGQVSQADVAEWLGAILPPPPDSIRATPDYPQRGGSDWVHDLLVELSLLEHYFHLIIDEIDKEHAIPYGLLNCLVQGVERCRRTHLQTLRAKGIESEGYKKPSHGAYASQEPVDLRVARKILIGTLTSIERILCTGEESISSENPLREILDDILSILQNAGVTVH